MCFAWKTIGLSQLCCCVNLFSVLNFQGEKREKLPQKGHVSADWWSQLLALLLCKVYLVLYDSQFGICSNHLFNINDKQVASTALFFSLFGERWTRMVHWGHFNSEILSLDLHLLSNSVKINIVTKFIVQKWSSLPLKKQNLMLTSGRCPASNQPLSPAHVLWAACELPCSIHYYTSLISSDSMLNYCCGSHFIINL